jgi:uncharacterized protein YbjT (DUF2867 family)
MKYFIYGASGLVGSELVRLLLKKGETVIGTTREPKKQKKIDNMEWVATDVQKVEQGTDKLKGIDRLFLLSPPGYMDQYTILKPWIDSAKKNGVKKVVLMTAMGVEHSPPEVSFRKLEIYLETSGLEYVILRPNWFMQNFHTFWISGILKDRKIYFPGGDSKASFIDSRDISASILGAFEKEEVKNRAFLLTGREAIDHFEVAQKLSSVSGLTILYEDISPEVFFTSLKGAGLPEDYCHFLVMIAGALKEGHSIAITGDVKYLSGQEPRKFDDYANDYKKHWV